MVVAMDYVAMDQGPNDISQKKLKMDVHLTVADRIQAENINRISVKDSGCNEKSLPANAYQPWTSDDDQLLTVMYRDKISTKEIAKTLHRGKGAISSRLKKLKWRT